MKCGHCGEEGHNARGCTKRGGGGSGGGPRRKSPPAPLAAVAATDIQSIKAAVVGVIDALESVDPPQRARVIRSAMLILGDDDPA